MRYYKSIASIKAISFDLDDTLYNNQPVILGAEAALLNHLQQNYLELSNITKSDIHNIRQHTIAENPALKDDVTKLRQVWLAKLFNDNKIAYSNNDISAAFDAFMDARNKVELPQETKHVLAKLAARFPLVAISNGNVNASAIGLDQYFTDYFFAGGELRMKPEADMFDRAIQSLNIQPSELLHVGDNLHADILGANRFGVNSCYLNPYASPENSATVPHLHITKLTDLLNLL